MLSSSRRVKKGPGRRPLSAKRQRFMELRERGWSIQAAAREVGVSRTAGNNWVRGYKTYRAGQVTGFVPALERLVVREISSRYLSQDERIEIADLQLQGLSVREIGRRVGRAASTVSRELRRNAGAGGYGPFDAHRLGPLAEPVTTGAGSTRTTCCEVSWPSCWGSGGALNRSADTSAAATRRTGRCGCAMRASTRPYTVPARLC